MFTSETVGSERERRVLSRDVMVVSGVLGPVRLKAELADVLLFPESLVLSFALISS